MEQKETKQTKNNITLLPVRKDGKRGKPTTSRIIKPVGPRPGGDAA